MGKLDVQEFRHLTPEDFRVLTAIEMGMKNHELINLSLVSAIANLKNGGTCKHLNVLCKRKLLQYERGKRFDGYRLTNQGYDYLALHSLTKRGVIESFGNQIGVGKESNIYIVADSEGEELCLKMHRLGRTCFRKIKEKRDYHKHRQSASWLYLSRISATKEFAYMKALYEREFPVPKPIDFNRHIVVMELVGGTLLNNVADVANIEDLYDDLMNIIVRFAECGVIHGDFNEFNIMVTDEGKPVIIDFPQMMSTEHSNAEMYFNRDVNCINEFFKKRFGFESEQHPLFSDIVRKEALDAEVMCTGMTKQMAKDLNIELGINESSEESETEEEESKDNKIKDEEVTKTADELERLHVEGSDFKKNIDKQIVQNWLDRSKFTPEESDYNSEPPQDLTTTTLLVKAVPEHNCNQDIESKGNLSNELEEEPENSIKEGPAHPDTKLKDKRLDKSERSSMWSSTSTVIPPGEVSKRVMKEMVMKRRKDYRKACLAKGEASAITRARRDNNLTIKESGNGIWD